MINSYRARYIGRTSVGPSSPGLDPVTQMSRVFAPSQKKSPCQEFLQRLEQQRIKIWNEADYVEAEPRYGFFMSLPGKEAEIGSWNFFKPEVSFPPVQSNPVRNTQLTLWAFPVSKTNKDYLNWIHQFPFKHLG